MSYWLPTQLMKPLDEYRARRKIERGKMLTRQRAIDEILEAVLSAQPKAKPLPSFEEVVERLEKLEESIGPMLDDDK